MTSPADELVDVINESGETVRVATRAEMRTGRLPHRCVYILMFNTLGEVFIHERTPTKDIYPGYWDVAAGGVLAAGESFELGAERECAEELGVTASLECLFTFRYEDERTVVQAMVYRAVHDGPFRLQPEEVVRGRFVNREELETLVTERPFCPDGLLVWRKFEREYGPGR